MRPHLESCVQDKQHGHTGKSKLTGHEDDEGVGAYHQGGKAERVQAGQLGKEKLRRDITNMHKYLTEECKEDRARLFSAVTSDAHYPEAMGTKCERGHST